MTVLFPVIRTNAVDGSAAVASGIGPVCCPALPSGAATAEAAENEGVGIVGVVASAGDATVMFS